jgi:hypothetical protein
VIRRHIKRTLPVKLHRDELTDIAIVATRKRRQLRELEADLGAEKKQRQQQIDELQREIDVHDRELDTEEQERVVSCNEVFRDGLVWTVRTDTSDEFESRPATAQEAQRYLPAMESTLQVGPALLDQRPLHKRTTLSSSTQTGTMASRPSSLTTTRTTAWGTPLRTRRWRSGPHAKPKRCVPLGALQARSTAEGGRADRHGPSLPPDVRRAEA